MIKDNPKQHRQQRGLSLIVGLVLGVLIALVIFEVGGSTRGPGASEVQERHATTLIGALGDTIHSAHLPHLCPQCPACSDTLGEVGNAAQRQVAASATVSEKYARGGNPELRVVLETVAINREVLIAVSNHALIHREGTYGMLKTWIDGVQRAGVKNALVIALDDQTAEACRRNNMEVFRMNPKSLADKQASNHGISALKFQILREFLILGYHVFLSDVDVVILQDPFRYLHRDTDVAAMSDGWEDYRAYGFDDVQDDPDMGWSRYSHTFRIWHYNSGLFYLRASDRTIELMDRITERLGREKAWDQAIFNEYIWFPSHGDYKGAHVSSRVLDTHQFMNSKTLFKSVRGDPFWKDTVPVLVHVNYHSNKFERMLAIVDRYVNNKKDALDRFTLNS